MFNRRLTKMLNAQNDGNKTIQFRPFREIAETSPQIKSIYYPKNRYGGATERSALEEFATEVNGFVPE